MPPCVIDADWGPPIVAHATVDPEGRVKVLVVAKSLTSNDLTNVRLCIANASAAGLAGPTAAQWEPLIAPQVRQLRHDFDHFSRISTAPCHRTHARRVLCYTYAD